MSLRTLHVARARVGVKRYVELVEQSVIDLASRHFLLREVGRTENPGEWVRDSPATLPGVWVQRTRKLAAVGIRVRDGVTGHGLALNCDPDLAWFEQVVPCGLEGTSATSLSRELARPVPVRQVLRPFCECFARCFDRPVPELAAPAEFPDLQL